MSLKKPRRSVSSKQNTRKENYQLQLSAGVLPRRLSPYQFMAVLWWAVWLDAGPMVQKFAVLHWPHCYSPPVASIMTLALLHNVFHQWYSRSILGLFFTSTILLSFVALQRLDGTSVLFLCLICYAMPRSPLLILTEENAYMTHCTNATLFLLFLILFCSIKSLSQLGPFQLAHFCYFTLPLNRSLIKQFAD